MHSVGARRGKADRQRGSSLHQLSLFKEGNVPVYSETTLVATNIEVKSRAPVACQLGFKS